MVGSFILAIVSTIRIIVAYLAQSQKKNENQNAAVKAMMKCLECCLWCWEKCMKLITENAIIHMAFKPEHWFCCACAESFKIWWDNIFLFTITGFLSTGFELLGLLVITLSNTCISYLILTQTDPWQDTVTNAFPALTVVVLMSILVSLTFMNVWGFSCRALL